MCGISGILSNSRNKNFLKKNIKLMIKSLNHRGPDDHGEWIDENFEIALGHNRLSIQDLSKKGSQPMISSNKNLILIFNGEIYNHFTLREKLNCNWNGRSDTETLIEYIQKYGVDKTLKDVSGMFAFAIWNKRKKELILARDYHGEKPLYFGWFNNLFVFASELKSIMSINKAKFKINKNSVLELLRRSFIPSPMSILEKMYKLSPGTYLKIKGNCKFENKRNNNILANKNFRNFKIINWKNKISHNNYKYTNPNKKIKNLLEESVKEQLISDVPVGCLLSGGIDSSVVSIIANKYSNKKLSTFNISIDDDDFDEAVYSKIVSKKIKSKHFIRKFKSSDMLSLTTKLCDIYCEPFADSSQLPTIFLSQFSRKYVKVVLTGDGGDEFFGGYNRYYKLNNYWHLSTFFPRKLIKIFFKFLYKIPNKYIENFSKLINFLGIFKKNMVQFNLKFQKISYSFSKSDNLKQFYDNVTKENWISKEILNNTKTYNNFNIEKNFLNKKEENIKLKDLILLDQSVSLSDDMMCKVDRASMFFGLETRAPMLNRNMTNYLNNLPKRFKYLKRNKIFLKNLLDEQLYEGFSKRPKMGFSIPLAKWLRTDLKSFMIKTLDKHKIKNYKILKWSEVNKKIQEHLDNKKNNERFLWSVIILNQWLDKNKEKIIF